jgi:hypothetical protein
MKKTCCICGVEVGPATSKVIVLTATERATILKLGQDPPTEYVYCRPCMSILSNRERGAQLQKGVFQARLRASGVAAEEAERRAQKLYEFLVAQAKG